MFIKCLRAPGPRVNAGGPAVDNVEIWPYADIPVEIK